MTAVVAAGVVALTATAGSGPALTVVATGLNNPRQVWAMPDGSVYVAEAGKAGPAKVDKETFLGYTGSVTRWSPGKKQRVVSGLVSFGGKDGSFTAGSNGVAVDPTGAVYVAVSAVPECGPVAGVPAKVKAQVGQLLRFKGGQTESVADLNGLECKNNYDRTDRNSNPYAVLALGGAHEIVVDAGANALFDVRGKQAKLLALLPKQSNGAQSVPTSIARGPDGAYYVGEFVGEGTRKPKVRRNAARVFRVSAGGKVTVFARGFNAVTGVAFGSNRTLYVTEWSIDPTNERNAKGDVVAVDRSGKRTRLGVGRLFFPSGASVGPDGSVYVSNWSVLPATPAQGGPFKGKTGELVRIRP